MVRALISMILLGAVLLAAPAEAQDRRAVGEPSLPAQVCATLSPSTASAEGRWPEETGRLQSAIDHCSSGGAVRLVADAKGGRFLSGPLTMKSGVTLWIDRGATLSAVPDPRAYDTGARLCGSIAAKGNGCLPFITFKGTTGGGIVGDGEIDGLGGAVMVGHDETWWQMARRADKEGGKQNNPRLIQADRARDLTFYRITLRNAANFHVMLSEVEGATFWGVKIDTPADARNTDGIDPAASQDITIAHSSIRTGDDNIAIKAGKGATRHVSILDDHFYWGHGLSIGSETNAGVSDILVRNVTLDGTTSGLRIKSDVSRGGLVTRVRYEDVCLRDNQKPIDFDTRYDASARGLSIPVYEAISLHDVTGADGRLILRGHDPDHRLTVQFDGVRFGQGATWQVENAELFAGAGGVSPTPPGLTLTPAAGPAPDCAGRWAPFPE
ncbi:glycoside hydrolase family 28 protein [Nitrospirillum sp. BR 11828]|uniref:glycoside hydrolase family 28 protein n=1 Tax=Nitrospirillum sp. BR 11828 TaxID=3104325 RepID=UPI002ACA8A51|nr:glycosyl hydrolase family 28 protein [Nitrospirillum sp. BR 11828]MDZ5649362.1 glycosyl hydrolase family 28 protein [Nitrospirillum sp. BR 11828]